MNIKSIALATVLLAFTGSAMAASAPLPPSKAHSTHAKKQLNTACKIVKGKPRCHKSPYKSKIAVEPYKGKPKATKKN